MKLSTVELTKKKPSEFVPEKPSSEKPKGRYLKMVEEAKSNGIPKATLNSRLYKYGWDERRAVTEPVGFTKRGKNRKPLNRKRFGEDVPTSKLTEELVLKIRDEYIPRDRKRGTRALARKYKVSQATVFRAVTRKSWSHLPDGKSTEPVHSVSPEVPK